MRSRACIVAEGLVQGVFFRSFLRDRALSLGVTGWVRNRPDGRVEAVFEGEHHKVTELIASCREGPPGARVTALGVKWEDCTGEFAGFSIRR